MMHSPMMHSQTLSRSRTITATLALVAALLVLLTLIAPNTLLLPEAAVTHEPRGVSSSIPVVAPVPMLISRRDTRFLVRRGATAPELAAENQRRWDRVQLHMLDDPWIAGLLRHRSEMTVLDLASTYLSRR